MFFKTPCILFNYCNHYNARRVWRCNSGDGGRVARG